MAEIDSNRGSVQGLDGVPKDVQALFVTTSDIAPESHVRMQAEFQKSTDSAVSKTVNLPNNASVAEAATLFTLAWESGCKGITIYRDGSRGEQPLTAESNCPTGTCSL